MIGGSPGHHDDHMLQAACLSAALAELSSHDK